jgi:hypothetical protein
MLQAAQGRQRVHDDTRRAERAAGQQAAWAGEDEHPEQLTQPLAGEPEAGDAADDAPYDPLQEEMF